MINDGLKSILNLPSCKEGCHVLMGRLSLKYRCTVNSSDCDNMGSYRERLEVKIDSRYKFHPFSMPEIHSN